jgi:hypothetical protein
MEDSNSTVSSHCSSVTTDLDDMSSIASDTDISSSDNDLQHNLQDVQDLEDLAFLQRSTSRMRSERWGHERLDWSTHVEQLLHEGKFNNEYLMSPQAHAKLVRILDPALGRVEYNSRCSEPILVEHIMAVGLRVLGGGTVKDQRHIIHSCCSAAYDAFDDFIDAVNAAPELDIHMPQSQSEWEQLNREWRNKSTNEIIAGCVTALDGFFQRCNKPTKNETANPMAYFSGHYQSFGLNCQACVRADLRFIYFCVTAPGSTNDNIAFAQAPGLKEFFDSLPIGLYGLADAAYTLCEALLTPFVGSQRHDPAQDAFNFYLSQLRIRVEMAFGRLVNKFRILSGKINGSIDRVSAILMACVRLHNYIIQEDGPFECNSISVEDEIDRLQITPNTAAPLGMSYLPVVPDENFVSVTGVSYTREAIVDYLREHEISRPLYNIERKRAQLQEERDAVAQNIRQPINCDVEYVSP